MTASQKPMTEYQIRLKGHLDEHWQLLFEGFLFRHEYDAGRQPVTVITGAVRDQAALYGVIGRFRDLGVALISVQPVEGQDAPGEKHPA